MVIKYKYATPISTLDVDFVKQKEKFDKYINNNKAWVNNDRSKD